MHFALCKRTLSPARNVLEDKSYQKRHKIDAAKVDDALRKAYARCFGADLLNAEGTWERQEDPTFHRDLMGLKASAGGGGYRNTARRAAFSNAIANALPQMIGSETRQPLWSSLESVLGADPFKKKRRRHVLAHLLRFGISMGHQIQVRDSEN